MVANNKNQQFAVFCGLPRTGSTLLINLLMQNPSIHGEGASLLCELMWQTQQLCDNNPPLFANNKQDTKKDIISAPLAVLITFEFNAFTCEKHPIM
jgi:hypothetical protein